MLKLTNEPLNKESNGDNVEDEQIKDVLSVLFYVSSDTIHVPPEPALVRIRHRVYVKTCHPEISIQSKQRKQEVQCRIQA